MRKGFLWLLLTLTSPTLAGDALFYQPLNVDARISQAQWQKLWSKTAEAGFSEVIVQWTRHGSSDFGGASGWLMHSLREAEAKGLRLVLGLYYDPRYYQRMGQTHQAHEHWREWLLAGLRQQRWLTEHSGLTPAGWYIPMELDDQLYRDPGLRKALNTDLASFTKNSLLPVHISTFSAGQLSPDVYAAWLHSIPVEQVWWQDGRGTRALPNDILDSYRAAFSCDVGIIHEAFLQTSKPNAEFSAESTTPDLRDSCHPTAVFSLRYQPWGRPLLDALNNVEVVEESPASRQLRVIDAPDD